MVLAVNLETDEGDSIGIPTTQKIQLGRESIPGLSPGDRTVSRQVISLELQKIHDESNKSQWNPDEEIMVSFQILGKNPVCISRVEDTASSSRRSGEEKKPQFFRRPEKGFLKIGDEISFSVRNPKFFRVKRVKEEDEEEKGMREAVERRKKRTMERKLREEEEFNKKAIVEGEDESNVGFVNLDSIDPVKEFGFLVIGHEFDQYDKRKIRDIKNWNWYLQDLTKDDDYENDSDDTAEGDAPKRKKREAGRKKINKDDNHKADDEDWTGESEEEKDSVSKLKSSKRPRPPATRSKEHESSSSQVKERQRCEDDEDSLKEVDDETLGGFIVEDEQLEEQDGLAEEEEEEEFVDDDDEIEDD